MRWPREVWGRGLRDPAARSASSSSSGFSLRHPLPRPVSPLTPPPGSGLVSSLSPLPSIPARLGLRLGAPFLAPLSDAPCHHRRVPGSLSPRLRPALQSRGAGAGAGAQGACGPPLEGLSRAERSALGAGRAGSGSAWERGYRPPGRSGQNSLDS